MNKKNTLVAYILIGVGVYFLLQQFDLPFLDNILSWPSLLIIIGIALLLHSLTNRDYDNIIVGVIVLGLGIHFYGLHSISNWIDHWAVYVSIIGIAMIIRSYWTKKGMFSGILLTAFSLFMIFSIQIPNPFHWIYDITNFLESFWPILIILFGIYLLRKR